MATNKKSFLLYCDIIHTVKKLPDDKAGELFKHILSYVNDENPSSNDILIDLVFEPIKQSLKRDLTKYKNIVERNRNNGFKGGRPKLNPSEPKKPSGLFGNPKNPSEPKKADIDSDSDSDSDIDIVEYKYPTIKEVKEYFAKNEYKESLAISFFEYYDCNDWRDKNGKRLVNWKIKACKVWFKDEYKIIKPKKGFQNDLKSLKKDGYR